MQFAACLNCFYQSTKLFYFLCPLTSILFTSSMFFSILGFPRGNLYPSLFCSKQIILYNCHITESIIKQWCNFCSFKAELVWAPKCCRLELRRCEVFKFQRGCALFRSPPQDLNHTYTAKLHFMKLCLVSQRDRLLRAGWQAKISLWQITDHIYQLLHKTIKSTAGVRANPLVVSRNL